jgi:hypothetical protein
MTSYCRVEDELPKQVVHPADWNLKELVGHIDWTCRCSKVHLERELVRPPCLWRMIELNERLFYVINGAYIIFIFMKGMSAYKLIPAHRTDRYKTDDLEIGE